MKTRGAGLCCVDGLHLNSRIHPFDGGEGKGRQVSDHPRNIAQRASALNIDESSRQKETAMLSLLESQVGARGGWFECGVRR